LEPTDEIPLEVKQFEREESGSVGMSFEPRIVSPAELIDKRDRVAL